MTDREKASAPAERVVVIDHAEMARRDAEARLAQEPMRQNTIPGGVYQAQDGRFHDAHGREVTESGELVNDEPLRSETPVTMQLGGPEVTDAAKAQAEDAEGEAWRKDMLQQRRESAEEPAPADAPILGLSELPPLDEDEVDETGTKTGRKVKRAAKRSRK